MFRNASLLGSTRSPLSGHSAPLQSAVKQQASRPKQPGLLTKRSHGTTRTPSKDGSNVSIDRSSRGSDCRLDDSPYNSIKVNSQDQDELQSYLSGIKDVLTVQHNPQNKKSNNSNIDWSKLLEVGVEDYPSVNSNDNILQEENETTDESRFLKSFAARSSRPKIAVQKPSLASIKFMTPADKEIDHDTSGDDLEEVSIYSVSDSYQTSHSDSSGPKTSISEEHDSSGFRHNVYTIDELYYTNPTNQNLDQGNEVSKSSLSQPGSSAEFEDSQTDFQVKDNKDSALPPCFPSASPVMNFKQSRKAEPDNTTMKTQPAFKFSANSPQDGFQPINENRTSVSLSSDDSISPPEISESLQTVVSHELHTNPSVAEIKDDISETISPESRATPFDYTLNFSDRERSGT